MSHEEAGGGAHAQPAPLRTARVFIMTARLRPATGPSTRPLHEVKHFSAGDSPTVRSIIFIEQEMSVQVAGSALVPPLATQVGLVLHLPDFSRRSWEQRGLGKVLIKVK